MTNYNDGAWHGWNGGECPVHPKSMVEYIWHDTQTNRFGSAQMVAGFNDSDERPAWPQIIHFRVVKEYREPREFWIVGVCVFESAREAKTAFPGCTPIHVREVTE